MLARAAVVLVAFAGCGRVGFDPVGDAADLSPCPVMASVTSGDIQIGALEDMHDAMIPLPLSRTLLVTTVREIEQSPTHGGTRCELLADRIHCVRRTAGTDYAQSSGIINVHWIAATFEAGVTVQRGIANTSDTNPSIITIAEVPLAESFIVIGGFARNLGAGWAQNEFLRARLVDATTLDIRNASGGEEIGWQVVRMAGARVERGTITMPNASSSVASMLANPDTTRSFSLTSYTLGAGSIGVFGTMARSSLPPGSGTIDFNRAAPGPALDISWEVVTPPFEMRHGTHTMAAGTGLADLPFTGLDPATSIALASGQSLLGPSGGETDFNGGTNDSDLVGTSMFTLVPTTTGMQITRTATGGNATVDWAQLDLAQPICP